MNDETDTKARQDGKPNRHTTATVEWVDDKIRTLALHPLVLSKLRDAFKGIDTVTDVCLPTDRIYAFMRSGEIRMIYLRWT